MLRRFSLTRSNATGYAQVLARIAVLALLAYVTYISSEHSIILTLIVFYCYCIVYNFSSWVGIGHELSHGTVFKSKSLNNLFLGLFSNLTFSNEALFLATHFEHHKSPHGCSDFESPHNSFPRREPTWGQRLYAVIDLPKIVNTVKYLWLNSQGIIPHNKLKELLEKKRKIEAISQSAREKIAYLMVIVAASLILKSIWPIAFLVLPNFVATCLTKNLALLQHPNHSVLKAFNLSCVTIKDMKFPAESLSDMQVRDGLDLQLPILFQFLYANMNFHATHHKNPAVPFYHLPKASNELLNSNEVIKIDISSGMLIRLMVQPL
jgi:fatty acid desaturase